jgi:hypothetical protein
VAVLVELMRRRREQTLATLVATFGPAVRKVKIEARVLVAWASLSTRGILSI